MFNNKFPSSFSLFPPSLSPVLLFVLKRDEINFRKTLLRSEINIFLPFLKFLDFKMMGKNFFSTSFIYPFRGKIEKYVLRGLNQNKLRVQFGIGKGFLI
ncbi:hypothetical protein JL36_08435 [Lactococcus cremoris]|nr:hypothetical protein JL36_08435 [Lactococcus cremoris]